MMADIYDSKNAAGHRDEANSDNDFLHQMKTDCARHLTKRKQIQPVTFCGLRFALFEKGKRECSSSNPAGDFWVHLDNSMCHNGSKVTSQFEKYHVSGSPHPTYSPGRNPCVFWTCGMLKGVLKDRELNPSDETEEAITGVWDGHTFNEVQSVFHNWMNPLLVAKHVRGRGGPETQR
jgi:hypothetical protein